MNKSLGIINQNKNIIYIAIATLAILLIPLLAMQFSKEVNWSFFDFTIAGILIFGTGLVYELVSKRLKTRANKVILAGVLVVVLFVVWVELAVGIFR